MEIGTEQTTQTTTPTLVKKLAEVMAEIDHVEKRGKNTFHGYNYVKAADLAHAVRRKLAEKRVFLLSSSSNIQRFEMQSEKGGISTAILLDMNYTFLDGDSGEKISFTIPGCGSDKGDKGIYKAITGSLKYALRNQFLIPDESDPENEDQEYDRGLNDLILAFRNIGVSIEMIEGRLGHSIGDMSEAEREIFRGIYASIMKDSKPVADFFKVAETRPPAPKVDHTPALAGDEPRPGEKAKRGRGRSPKQVPEPPPTEPHEDPIPTRETPPESGEQLSVDDRPATEDEKSVYIRPALRKFQSLTSQEDVRAFVLDFAGVKDTQDMMKSQWDAALGRMEKAHEGGIEKLRDLLKERRKS